MCLIAFFTCKHKWLKIKLNAYEKNKKSLIMFSIC